MYLWQQIPCCFQIYIQPNIFDKYTSTVFLTVVNLAMSQITIKANYKIFVFEATRMTAHHKGEFKIITCSHVHTEFLVKIDRLRTNIHTETIDKLKFSLLHCSANRIFLFYCLKQKTFHSDTQKISFSFWFIYLFLKSKDFYYIGAVCKYYLIRNLEYIVQKIDNIIW